MIFVVILLCVTTTKSNYNSLFFPQHPKGFIFSKPKYILNDQDKSASQNNKSFYSLFGWRTQPPNKYPQNTFNTPYDKLSRECSRKCYYQTGKNRRNCLVRCAIGAIEKAISRENFGILRGNFNYSHGHERNVATQGTNDPSCFHL